VAVVVSTEETMNSAFNESAELMALVVSVPEAARKAPASMEMYVLPTSVHNASNACKA